MTWLLVMTFCALGKCEEVSIDGFESEALCEAALTRAIDKQHKVNTLGIDHFFCRRANERRV